MMPGAAVSAVCFANKVNKAGPVNSCAVVLRWCPFSLIMLWSALINLLIFSHFFFYIAFIKSKVAACYVRAIARAWLHRFSLFALTITALQDSSYFSLDPICKDQVQPSASVIQRDVSCRNHTISSVTQILFSNEQDCKLTWAPCAQFPLGIIKHILFIHGCAIRCCSLNLCMCN